MSEAVVNLSNTVIITVIASIIGIIFAFGVSVWKTVAEARREKPLIEKGQKVTEERQKKLGFSGKIMPLYIDKEQLDSFYSQVKRENYPLQIDSLTRSRNSSSTSKLDGKFASVEGTLAAGEQTVFSEYKDAENIYETVLESLYDKGQLITDLETPNDADELLESNSYRILPNYRHEAIPQDVKEAIAIVRHWQKGILLERMDQLINKIVLIKGNFKVSVCKEQQLDVTFQGKGLVYIARGFCEHKTAIGKSTFVPDTVINISVFGYVSGVERREHTVIITPVAICRLLS